MMTGKQQQQQEPERRRRRRRRRRRSQRCPVQPPLLVLLAVLLLVSSSLSSRRSNVVVEAYSVLPPQASLLLPSSSLISSRVLAGAGARGTTIARGRRWTTTAATIRTRTRTATSTRIQSTTSIEIENSHNPKKHQQLLQRRLAAKDYIQTVSGTAGVPTKEDRRRRRNSKRSSTSSSNARPGKSRTATGATTTTGTTAALSSSVAAASSLASYQTLLDHEILSKAEEQVLGRKIQHSNDLTQQLETLMERNKQKQRAHAHEHEELPSSRIQRTQRRNELLEEKKPTKVKFQKRKMKQVKQREQRKTMMELYRYPEPEYDTNENENMSIEEELEQLLISRKGGRRSTEKVKGVGIGGLEQYTNDNFEYPDRDDDLDDDSMMMMEELGMTLYDIKEETDTESSLLSSPLPEDENDNDIAMTNMSIDLDINSDEMYQDDEKEEYCDDETEIASQKEPQSYKQRQQQQNNPLSQIGLQFQDIDLYVTEKDIINELGIQGGKEELLQILVQGSIAKQTMIKSNIKLVTSIAKKWYRGATVAQQNDNNRNRRKTDPSAMYGGSWSIPSLDEAIQQGIIGLSQAATRFEPARNFKFSTYATYYITNEIRQLFLSTKTGCLYVPQHFFTIRNKYQKLVEETYREHNSNTNTNSNTNEESAAPTTAGVLDLQTAAYKLKIPNPERLQFILKATESLLQLDAPITGSSGSTTSGGSSGSANPGNNNGGGNGGDATITYGEMLEWYVFPLLLLSSFLIHHVRENLTHNSVHDFEIILIVF